jgi:pimeloyl-ACP methyl ester carboxylesterase
MRRFVVIASVCVLAACGSGDGETAAGPSPSTSPTAAVVDGLFDVGQGRRLYLSCEGSGSPTLLLEAGGQSSSSDWPPSLTRALGAKTRTCVYDRAGTGQSDPAPVKKRMMTDVVDDLDALLTAAKVEGPLLLVGASFGGQVVLEYALHHPTRVAGLVILDTDWPTTDPKRSPDQLLTKAERQHIVRGDAWDNPSNIEHVAYQETLGETERAFRKLPGIPIRILSATRNDDCDRPASECARRIALSVQLQRQWLRLSDTAVQVKVASGHNMQRDAEDTVRAEILRALAVA